MSINTIVYCPYYKQNGQNLKKLLELKVRRISDLKICFIKFMNGRKCACY